MKSIKIVGLGGSFNKSSSGAATMENILAAASEAGAEVENLDISDLRLPMYEYGVDTPPEVATFVDKVRSAHGMVWCSPLYHGSIAGSFKNTIDWLQLMSRDDPPYLTGKIVALAATAGGEQALQAINTMEYIVRSLRGWTLPLTAPVSRSDKAFDKQGKPLEDSLANRFQVVGRELVNAVQRLRQK